MVSACGSNDEIEPVNVTLKFTHNWDGTPLSSSDFNDFKFTTENGELISIERLRYLVSSFNFPITTKNYQLIDLGQNSGLEISFTGVTPGTHQLKFTFGFADSENVDGIYPDLNIANFNVPPMLGGGYHYMQFDGKYRGVNNQEAAFNYHAIRAANNSQSNPWDNLLDTSFSVDLGSIEIVNNAEIEIDVNMAEWFKNPNTWDLSVLNTVLMPNFNAQQLMNENGKTVFSLGNVVQ